jgi:hypothetical protein
MNWKFGTIISVMLLMLISGATACHYHCGPTTSEQFELTVAPDIIAYPGQVLTFTVTGAGAEETWAFASHDYNAFNPPMASGPAPFVFTAPLQLCGNGHASYFTVTGTGTVAVSNTLSCVKKVCYKIKVVGNCPECPKIPSYCYGESAKAFTTSPLVVTLPAWMTTMGAVCSWTFDDPAHTVVTGNPATYGGWDTLTVGTHSVKLTIKIGNVIVFECTISFTVKPQPTGVVSWS